MGRIGKARRRARDRALLVEQRIALKADQRTQAFERFLASIPKREEEYQFNRGYGLGYDRGFKAADRLKGWVWRPLALIQPFIILALVIELLTSN